MTATSPQEVTRLLALTSTRLSFGFEVVGTSWESSMFFVPFIYVPLIGAADRFLGCKRIMGCNRIIDFDLARSVLFTHSQCVLARASTSN